MGVSQGVWVLLLGLHPVLGLGWGMGMGMGVGFLVRIGVVHLMVSGTHSHTSVWDVFEKGLLMIVCDLFF